MSQSFVILNIWIPLIMFAVIWKARTCELTRIGGGCPDLSKCRETCLPCYKGIGQIKYYCRSGGFPILLPTCVCVMTKGAPCQVPGCPKPPPVALPANFNQSQMNITA